MHITVLLVPKGAELCLFILLLALIILYNYASPKHFTRDWFLLKASRDSFAICSYKGKRLFGNSRQVTLGK